MTRKINKFLLLLLPIFPIISIPLVASKCNSKSTTKTKEIIPVVTKLRLSNLIKITNLDELILDKDSNNKKPRHEAIREALKKKNPDTINDEVLKDLFIGSIKENKATVYISKRSNNKEKYVINEKVVVTYKIAFKTNIDKLIINKNLNGISSGNNKITKQQIFEVLKNLNPLIKNFKIDNFLISEITNNKAKISAAHPDYFGNVTLNFYIYKKTVLNDLINQYKIEVDKLTNLKENLKKYEFDKDLLDLIGLKPEEGGIELRNGMTKVNVEIKYKELMKNIISKLDITIKALSDEINRLKINNNQNLDLKQNKLFEEVKKTKEFIKKIWDGADGLYGLSVLKKEFENSNITINFD